MIAELKLNVDLGKVDSKGNLIIPITIRNLSGDLVIPFGLNDDLAALMLKAWQEEEQKKATAIIVLKEEDVVED